ncbi:RNA-dependent RNA polymerase [Alternaria alternata virus 1]|uniref:RNA-directed RNA polymerase n=1 Tax=Alternaria alternata virus 1 TaxID=483537 RepID=A9CQL6_9VIRU|nr:RNA-dependent RNA polymerase [Alternaria alternata virus 1]BAF94335.1 RNA-dependent RNA polymerase [Alternaria alternata virus 1]
MRSDKTLLLLGFRNAAWLRAQGSHPDLGSIPKRAFVPEPKEIDACLQGIEDGWGDGAFWCQTVVGSGFPVFFVLSDVSRNVFCHSFAEVGGDVSVVSFGLTEARSQLYRKAQVCVVPKARPAVAYHRDLSAVARVLRFGVLNANNKLCDAYTDFVRSPVARTEETWGLLGGYPWRDLDALVASSTRAEYDRDADTKLVGFLDRLWGKKRGKGLGRQDKKTRAKAAMAWGDANLWTREVSFKRRHYYDLATFLCTMDEVWGDRAVAMQGGATSKEADVQCLSFRKAVRMVLSDLIFGPATYERIYLTVFWIFSTRWWPSLVPVLLHFGSLGMSDDEYTAVHKEMTAVVTSTWMVPGTCRQHQFSANFLNAEDLTGWSDRDSLKGGVCAEIIKFALATFEYKADVRDGGGEAGIPIRGKEGSPEEYLGRYRQAMYDLLRPMYARYAPNMVDLQAHMEKRMAWMSGGAVGRRAKELLGPGIAPPGSSKAYVAARADISQLTRDWGEMRIEVGGKGNERGSERTLLATDLRDQVSESYLLHAFKNRYGLIGVDVGETPVEMFKRHVTVASATDVPLVHHGRDKKVLAAWDYSKWDHHVMLAERLILVEVMRKLVLEFVQRPDVREDMLRELEVLESSHRTAIYRSRAFADAKYTDQVDSLIREGVAAGFKGEVQRLSADQVRITNYAGQQSGRRSTLESNTFYSRARLLVRDAELLDAERSIYLLNRADDVMEIYRAWEHARNAIDVMLLQGHKANKKKQVVQVRTGVYFRILYANGSMRGFPPRAVYACASAGPSMAASGGFDPVERLSSLSGALDRLARRGSGYYVARALYFEAEDYYRDVRVQLAAKADKYTRFTIPREVLRASPDLGGCGVLPPGCYDYDYTIKCSNIKGPNEQLWQAIRERLEKRHKFRGLADLQGSAGRAFAHDVPLEVPDKAWQQWSKRWRGDRAAQDGRGELLRAKMMAKLWRYKRSWHRDKKGDTWGLEGFGHLLSLPVDFFNIAWRMLRDCPGTGEVDRLMKGVQGPPAEGMLAKLWYGLGQDVISVLGRDVLEVIQSASAPGREFAAEWGWLPLDVREKFLRGHLGPAGAWMNLIPASFAPWLNQAVNFVLFQAFATGVRYRGSHWLLCVRQAITGAISRQFVNSRPWLMLH